MADNKVLRELGMTVGIVIRVTRGSTVGPEELLVREKKN
jgi:hypothetical protein